MISKQQFKDSISHITDIEIALINKWYDKFIHAFNPASAPITYQFFIFAKNEADKDYMRDLSKSELLKKIHTPV